MAEYFLGESGEVIALNAVASTDDPITASALTGRRDGNLPLIVFFRDSASPRRRMPREVGEED